MQHKTCKHCSIPLVVKQTRNTPEREKKDYYYTAYYFCPRCKRMYLDDKFKVENKSTQTLFAQNNTSDSPAYRQAGPIPVDVEIWTDGACSNNGRPNAKAAWAFVSGDYERAELVEGKQTNNTAEALAIYNALLWASEMKYKHIRISSDSQITLHNLSKPVEKIKVNQEIFARIFSLIKEKGLVVDYKKVPGHADDVNNNRADKLCNGLVGIK